MADISFDARAPEYERLLATCTLLPSRKESAQRTAFRIVESRSRYEAVETATGVPWFIVGVIHAMECGLKFDRHLHNGDPLSERTRQVPRGRPKAGTPPFSWEESAIDALLSHNLDKVQDWTPERICYELERYNGWGYVRYHASVNTPYLWSGTAHYAKGKYVKDGKWDANAVSGQSGAIAILKCAAETENEIALALTHKAYEPTTVADAEPETPAKASPVSIADLAQASRKVCWLVRIRKYMAGLGIGGTGLSLADVNDQAGQLHTFAQFFKDHAFVLFGAGCLIGIVAATILIQWITEDHKDGRYVPSREA